MLTWPDEPEFPTSEIFNGRRIAAQAFGFLAQLLVLGARALNRLLQHLELLALFHRLEQSLFPHERIHEDDAADEQQRILDRPSSATTGRCGARLRSCRRLFHE